MSFFHELEEESSPTAGNVGEAEDEIAAHGTHFIDDLGKRVNETSLAIQDLAAKVSLLLDDVTSAKSAKGALETLQRTQRLIEETKSLNRKFTIWVTGTPGVQPQIKLRKEKLMSALSHNVQTYNELSQQVTDAMGKAQSIRAATTTASDAGGSTRSASIFRESEESSHYGVPSLRQETASMLALSQDLRKVQSSFEATQVIFDELGTLVRQQAPHLDSLESQASNVKQHSRNANRELQKESLARRQRTKRQWVCFMCVLFVTLFILYVYAGATTSQEITVPPPAPPSDNLRGSTSNVAPSPQPIATTLSATKELEKPKDLI